MCWHVEIVKLNVRCIFIGKAIFSSVCFVPRVNLQLTFCCFGKKNKATESWKDLGDATGTFRLAARRSGNDVSFLAISGTRAAFFSLQSFKIHYVVKVCSK